MSSSVNTPTPTNVEQQQQLSPTFVRVPDFKAIYTNFIQAGYTAFDISFLLGETAGVNEGKLMIETKARVAMSPLEAKMFLVMVGTVIQKYEAQFGTIIVPAGISAALGSDETEGV